MNGEKVHILRNKLCDGEASKHIPKVNYGQLTLPYYQSQSSNLNKFIPYYVSVKTDQKIYKSPKQARPSAGWQVTAGSFLKSYRIHKHDIEGLKESLH